MSNPEFKRNLWLSFSTHRLVAMPALLALTFLAISLSDQQDKVADSLYSASVGLFIFVVWLWGARNANASIVDELRDKTWDQQRMSALSPWTMTWGKLFGSTSFNWYGGLMCLVVVATSGLNAGKPDVIATLLTLCAVGVLLHAALIALNLHTSQFEARLIQRGGMGWLAIISVFMFMPFFYATNNLAHVSWWNMEINPALFRLGSALLFAACTTFAAWRVTCNALQVRTRPWAWPAFACILAVYFAGFAHGADKTQALLLTGLFVAITMTYAALFSEPNTLLLWRKLRLLQSGQDWRGWLEHLPLWPTSLLLTFLFAVLLQLAPDNPTERLVNTPFFPQHDSVTLAMMLLRDACILLFFALAPNGKRAIGATMLYLLVLNLLLPFLAGVAGLDTVRYVLMPFGTEHSPSGSTLIMTVHAAIAIALVNWRLRKQP